MKPERSSTENKQGIGFAGRINAGSKERTVVIGHTPVSPATLARLLSIDFWGSKRRSLAKAAGLTRV